MPVLAQSVGSEKLNKFYLEQALLAYSIDKRQSSKEKCIKLNEILNSIVRDEIRYGVYTEWVMLPKETFDELFGETFDI